MFLIHFPECYNVGMFSGVFLLFLYWFSGMFYNVSISFPECFTMSLFLFRNV